MDLWKKKWNEAELQYAQSKIKIGQLQKEIDTLKTKEMYEQSQNNPKQKLVNLKSLKHTHTPTHIYIFEYTYFSLLFCYIKLGFFFFTHTLSLFFLPQEELYASHLRNDEDLKQEINQLRKKLIQKGEEVEQWKKQYARLSVGTSDLSKEEIAKGYEERIQNLLDELE